MSWNIRASRGDEPPCAHPSFQWERGRRHFIWSFSKSWGYPQSSILILDWDLPLTKTIHLWVPPWLWKPYVYWLGSTNVYHETAAHRFHRFPLRVVGLENEVQVFHHRSNEGPWRGQPMDPQAASSEVFGPFPGAPFVMWWKIAGFFRWTGWWWLVDIASVACNMCLCLNHLRRWGRGKTSSFNGGFPISMFHDWSLKAQIGNGLVLT